ncbi:hypothetical protein HAX54_051224 [Datura stramonium]|uniref:Uncharacterized protein n=1 Tax=Datura stramonium TaxID=4076 RepID=A0ABS8WR09_DATST|nr:hypothetical protein [Datura stramonium]
MVGVHTVPNLRTKLQGAMAGPPRWPLNPENCTSLLGEDSGPAPQRIAVHKLGELSGTQRQRCPDLEKFYEHLGKMEGAVLQTLLLRIVREI